MHPDYDNQATRRSCMTGRFLDKTIITCQFCESNRETNLYRSEDGTCQKCPTMLTKDKNGEWECRCPPGQSLTRTISWFKEELHYVNNECRETIEECEHYDEVSQSCLTCNNGSIKLKNNETQETTCQPIGLAAEHCLEIDAQDGSHNVKCKKCEDGFVIGYKNNCVPCSELGCEDGCSMVNLPQWNAMHNYEMCQRAYNCSCLAGSGMTRNYLGNCISCNKIPYSEVSADGTTCGKSFVSN